MSDRPVPAADVLSRELEGQLVLISPDNGKIRVLNATGAEIWRRLKLGESSTEIASALSSTFGIPLEVAASDVDSFIADLTARGLLLPPVQ